MRTNDATSLQPVVAGILDGSLGRLGAAMAAVAGLIGIGLGVLALARSARRTGRAAGGGHRPGRPVVAAALGLTGIVLAGLVLATADDGIGTGNGRGGAYVAVVLGLIAVSLGGLARVRTRRDGVALRRSAQHGGGAIESTGVAGVDDVGSATR